MIAPETIDRIRQSANIADVVGQSVKLERRGRNLLGLCPFHKEKSPSFNVNEERGFYHCFGCKASGDVFKFIQETEGLTFIEAVRSLGEKLGIEVEDDLSSEERKRRNAERRRELGLYDVNQAAAQYFEQCLEKAQHREVALQELEKRGLPWTVGGEPGPAQQVLKSFRVGYAPHGWDGLASHLRKIGHDLRAAEAVGLLAPRRGSSGYYDRFRHRLMFAVIDLHNRVVAFSGRALPPVGPEEGEAPAKYINSPESPIYQKRSTVFGLYQARNSLRAGKPATVVEGNFDVVSMHAAGFDHAVAPLGTAFTEEQGKQIRRFTQNVVLLFDGDSAGRKATLASREPAREAGLTARVARLPDGLDPDDFIRTRGTENLKNLLNGASGMLDYQIGEILDEHFVASDAVGRAQKIRQVAELLAAEDDPNVRALAEQHADRLAGRLGVADAHTFRALKEAITATLRAPKVTMPAPAASSDEGPPHFFDDYEEARQRTKEDAIAEMALGAVLDFPDLLLEQELAPYYPHLEGDVAAAIACLRSALRTHASAEALNAALPQYVARFPVFLRAFAEQRIAAPKHAEIDVARVELFANLDKLRRMELARQSSGAYGEMERARQEGDFDQELELLKEQERRARARRGL